MLGITFAKLTKNAFTAQASSTVRAVAMGVSVTMFDTAMVHQTAWRTAQMMPTPVSVQFVNAI